MNLDFPPEKLPAQVGRVPVVAVHAVPDALLRLVVVADGERHELIEVHLLLPEQLEELGRHVGQLQPATHRQRHDAEANGDLLDSCSVLDHLRKGANGVGHAHGLASAVLGRAGSESLVPRGDHARDLFVLADLA